MRNVKIVLVESTAGNARVWGEVKALDMSGMPTIAHCEAVRGDSDAFMTMPGRHSFHFRVGPECKLTLSTLIDGQPIGPPREIDATEITAGLRYHFEVPS